MCKQKYQMKIRDDLFVQTGVPPDEDVVLRLSLFNLLVVIGLHLDKRSENVLLKYKYCIRNKWQKIVKLHLIKGMIITN